MPKLKLIEKVSHYFIVSMYMGIPKNLSHSPSPQQFDLANVQTKEKLIKRELKVSRRICSYQEMFTPLAQLSPDNGFRSMNASMVRWMDECFISNAGCVKSSKWLFGSEIITAQQTSTTTTQHNTTTPNKGNKKRKYNTHYYTWVIQHNSIKHIVQQKDIYDKNRMRIL